MAKKNITRQVEDRIAQALAPLGFARLRRDRLAVLVKRVDENAEIYLYPGVSRHRGKIIVDPVIGLDFLPLRKALEEMASNPTTQICHCYLGLIEEEPWISLELLGETIEADGLQIITTAVHVALAELLPLCSAQKICEFFQDRIHRRHESRSQFVDLQSEIKLEVLERLMSEAHFGIVH